MIPSAEQMACQESAASGNGLTTLVRRSWDILRSLDGNGWTGCSLLLLVEGQTGGVLHVHQGSLEEEAKLALEAIGLQERKALEQFYAGVRKASRQVRVLAERNGGDVFFNFDSNGRSVWVIALFGKGAPPTLWTISDEETPWISVDDEQEGD